MRFLPPGVPRGCPAGQRTPPAPLRVRKDRQLRTRPRPPQTRPPRSPASPCCRRPARPGLAATSGSKWRWRRRAAGYETRGRHMAAPAPNLAGPAASRRPGEAGPTHEEAARRPPLTHRPVAQDRDLPGLGLRHLGGLLNPGPTTSTAAAAAAAATPVLG